MNLLHWAAVLENVGGFMEPDSTNTSPFEHLMRRCEQLGVLTLFNVRLFVADGKTFLSWVRFRCYIVFTLKEAGYEYMESIDVLVKDI